MIEIRDKNSFAGAAFASFAGGKRDSFRTE